MGLRSAGHAVEHAPVRRPPMEAAGIDRRGDPGRKRGLLSRAGFRPNPRSRLVVRRISLELPSRTHSAFDLFHIAPARSLTTVNAKCSERRTRLPRFSRSVFFLFFCFGLKGVLSRSFGSRPE